MRMKLQDFGTRSFRSFEVNHHSQHNTSIMEALNQAEQQELQQRMEKRQMKGRSPHKSRPASRDWHNRPIDFMGMYSKLVDKCFNDCVDDFSSKSISSREEGCVMRCWDKNMKGQERIQQRSVIEAQRRIHWRCGGEHAADTLSVLDSKNTTSRWCSLEALSRTDEPCARRERGRGRRTI